jgi:hypothetical protein
MKFKEHRKCANVTCQGLVVKSLFGSVSWFICQFLEFVDDSPFCFYEVFGVAALLRFFDYTPLIYRICMVFCGWVRLRFGHGFSLPSSVKSESQLWCLLSP